jgi:hypothetical protein
MAPQELSARFRPLIEDEVSLTAFLEDVPRACRKERCRMVICPEISMWVKQEIDYRTGPSQWTRQPIIASIVSDRQEFTNFPTPTRAQEVRNNDG